jgi:hypothetical protein
VLLSGVERSVRLSMILPQRILSLRRIFLDQGQIINNHRLLLVADIKRIGLKGRSGTYPRH